MRQETASHLTLGALLVLSLVVVLASAQLQGVSADVASLARKALTPDPPMQTLTETVTRRDGRTITVTTTRLENESVTDFIARHDAVTASLRDS